jgi:hypothetical protein
MNAQLQPIAQLTQRATDALIKELGVVDTIRFLNQFRAGNGDYTAERERLFQGMTVAEIADQIRAQRKAGA